MLYIAATPIGNLEDITLRTLSIFKTADLILAEDTRKTGFLLAHFKIKKKLSSFYEHNEIKKIPAIIKELEQGKNIVLVSSAGTPSISDPGYKLIRECRLKSIPLTALPGPSSVINALSLTSFSHEKFAYLGYLPRKSNACKILLEKCKKWDLALVFFESPYRIIKSLNILQEVFGPSEKIAIFREMTKKFEEVLETSLAEAIEYFTIKKPKGEFTLVIRVN